MFKALESDYQKFKTQFYEYYKKYFISRKNQSPSVLWESIEYSFDNGGKRFRPFLAYLVARTFNVDTSKAMSIALATEMIHTYSLIHDDLPSMDNDDMRRGQPTNHKKFGEDIALLAGDALQAEAFACLANDMINTAENKIKVIQIFAKHIGVHGMVGGQVLDMKATHLTTLFELEDMHRKKTGDLISAAVLGAAIFSSANETQYNQLESFSRNLGLAFQIKDDLLDGLDNSQNNKSYLKILGPEQTLEKLFLHSSAAKNDLEQTNLNSDLLKKMIDFNLNREI